MVQRTTTKWCDITDPTLILWGKFYLPKEWRRRRQEESLSGHGKSKATKGSTTCWQESKINYSFDNEMNGTQLIRNLNWLGRTKDLLEMNVSDDEEEDNDNEDDVNV